MTSLEHALIGIHGALALGVHRRFGWRAVAFAGIASILPDWDGIPMLLDMARFESAHRVWGHSVLVMAAVSLLVAIVQVRWDPIGRVAAKFVRNPDGPNGSPVLDAAVSPNSMSIFSALLIAFVAQVLHIPGDMVIASGKGLADWSVQPWWPVSRAGYLYPMIPWGDPSATVILMTGAIVAARRRRNVSLISGVTIGILVAYLIVRRCYLNEAIGLG